MTERNKIKRYLRREMRKILGESLSRVISKKNISSTTFGFCFNQAKFDTLMEIDMGLKLGAFYKKPKEVEHRPIDKEDEPLFGSHLREAKKAIKLLFSKRVAKRK